MLTNNYPLNSSILINHSYLQTLSNFKDCNYIDIECDLENEFSNSSFNDERIKIPGNVQKYTSQK